MEVVLIAIISLLTCIGQICQKKAIVKVGNGKILCSPWLHAGLLSLSLALFLWLSLLQSVPLSVAYPLVMGLNFVGVTLMAAILFQESIKLRQIIGMVWIVIGTLLLSWGK